MTSGNTYLTIGQLARQAGLATSTLRYYETQGLLTPERSESGYRLYPQTNLMVLNLISRAQQLGFTLAEIKQLLGPWQAGQLTDTTILELAEARYVALEQQFIDILLKKRELGYFLEDLRREHHCSETAGGQHLDQLVASVCQHPHIHPESLSESLLMRLMAQAGCTLSGQQAKELMAALRGQHVHMWRQDDSYHVVIVSDSAEVNDPLYSKLVRLVTLEASCNAHPALQVRLSLCDEGYKLRLEGKDAVVLARCLLSLDVTNSDMLTPVNTFEH
ncbi:MAG: MerR family transcriptional regulator [Deinococcota bacterium]